MSKKFARECFSCKSIISCCSQHSYRRPSDLIICLWKERCCTEFLSTTLRKSHPCHQAWREMFCVVTQWTFWRLQKSHHQKLAGFASLPSSPCSQGHSALPELEYPRANTWMTQKYASRLAYILLYQPNAPPNLVQHMFWLLARSL